MSPESEKNAHVLGNLYANLPDKIVKDPQNGSSQLNDIGLLLLFSFNKQNTEQLFIL